MGLVTRYLKTWNELGPYERFEQVLALLLTVVIAVVIIGSLADLVRDVYDIFATAAVSLSDRAFAIIFGDIMTVLIALEFNHSIVQVLHNREHLIQVRTVVLIAILAIARKFIVIDVATLSAETLIALAVVAAALALLHWVLAATDRADKARE